jgi:flavin reductase (DIM6/NTAB) family NADH-FMN oxidoreductase RutF/rubredoxin
MDSRIFRNMSYGVYVVSSVDGDRPTGCIANSIMQITSSPATIAVSMNHDNYTNWCIQRSGKFAFSILSEKSDPGIIGTFGFHSGKDTDKFADVAYEMAEGMPVVKDSCGYVVCKVIDRMETATHTVFLGEVIESKVYENVPQMTYAYYHAVVKGKSPKNAPTYEAVPNQAEVSGKPAESSKKTKFVCDVCGYVYESDTDTVPEGFTCPICGVGPEHFKKQ